MSTQHFNWIIVPITLFFCTLFFLFPSIISEWVPGSTARPFNDSIIYAYAGQQISSGSLIYKDISVTKGPLLYLIHLIGLFLGNGSYLGTVILRIFLVFISSMLSFFSLKKFTDRKTALITTFCLLFSFSMMSNNSCPEEFSIIFQMLSLYILSSYKRLSFMPCFLLGIFFSLTFLLKPTLIGLWLGLIFYWFISYFNKKNLHQLFKKGSYFFCGIILVNFLLFSYFYSKNIIHDFFQHYFYYNSLWANLTYNNAFIPNDLFMKPVIIIFRGMIKSIYYYPFISICFLIIFIVTLSKHYWKTSPSVFKVATFSLPFQCILINISNHHFWYYYIALIPSCTIILGVGLFHFSKHINFNNWVQKNLKAKSQLISFIALLLFLPPQVIVIEQTIKRLRAHANDKNYIKSLQDVSLFVENNTTTKDLVFSDNQSLLFLSNRSQGHRFINLDIIQFNDNPIIFQSDIRSKLPSFIILEEPFNVRFPHSCKMFIKTLVNTNYKLKKNISHFFIYEKIQ